MLYRIITERKNYSDVLSLLKYHFDGFTLYRATGVYTNEIGSHIEPALIIEIDDMNNEKDFVLDRFEKCVKHVAEKIKEMNSQDAVLLQKIKSESELI